MGSWLLKALHVLVNTVMAALLVAMGVYMILYPVNDQLLISRGLGLFGIMVGSYWFWLMKRST